jgi:hypothetical protein
MREDWTRDYQRWLTADLLAAEPEPGPASKGRRRLSVGVDRAREQVEASDEEADAAFAAVFESCVSTPLPSAQFTSDTMAAIAAATAADARRTALARKVLLWTGAPAGVALIYFGAGPVFSALSSALVASLNLLVALVVWFANGADVRSSLWSVMTGIGRAAAAFVADPRVTIAIVVFQVVAVAALAALHRLLGPEREWLK